MLKNAEKLSCRDRRKFRLYAYASTWFGCFADIMPESTAVIILYLAMLGASNTTIMLSTGISGIVSMFLLIPASCLVDKLGPRKVVNISCILTCVSYLGMSAAPFFRRGRCTVCRSCLLCQLLRIKTSLDGGVVSDPQRYSDAVGAGGFRLYCRQYSRESFSRCL